MYRGRGSSQKRRFRTVPEAPFNEPPRSKLRGIWSLILPLPAMGGDQGEGDASDIPALHPHLTSPIKGEEPISYRELQVQDYTGNRAFGQ